MKNEKKFLFKRRIKFFFVSSIILLGLSAILWFFAYTDDIAVEETKQDSSKDEFKIPLKDINDEPKELPKESPSDKESIDNNSSSPINNDSHPQPEMNSENSSSSSSHPEKLPPESSKETTPPPEESQPVTTIPTKIKIKNYKTFNLTLRNETTSPDGFSRHVYTINNQFPGPELVVNKGDTIRINVTNYIGRPTTIHVHGMIQIQNGSSFTYEFEATHPGTYW
jgi:FtsP/CotA-like multicopper oxidase with cupredoxin domain